MGIDFEEIRKMALESESPTIEFKLTAPKDIGETISAFANTYGGSIIFGVDPKKKELVGLRNPDEESRRIRQALDQCKPNPKPEQIFVSGDGKTFILLKIEPFAHSQNPCFFNKNCYIRQGTTNLVLAGEELIDFLKKRSILNFEELKSKAQFQDVNQGLIKEFLEKRKIETRDLGEDKIKGILASLNIANFNGEFFLKNVAVLFFVKSPQRFLNNAEFRIVKYEGAEREIGKIKFDRRYYGTIPDLIKGSFKIVSENIRKSYQIVGPERKEVLEYPADALREVLTNAFGHRDYFEPQEVLIEIFDDRVQTTNPGGFLDGQNTNNFDKVPKHRNPLCYRLLHDFGLGEGLCLGIRLIRKQCREWKLPDPEFYGIGNVFQAVLYNKNSIKARHAPEFENKRQKDLLIYLHKKETIKAAEYARMVGVSVPTAINDINELIKQGKIKKTGKYRGAHYSLIKIRPLQINSDE